MSRRMGYFWGINNCANNLVKGHHFGIVHGFSFRDWSKGGKRKEKKDSTILYQNGQYTAHP